jgi:hypothetical protein
MPRRFSRRDRAEVGALAERLTAEVEAGRLAASDRLVRLLRAVVMVAQRR